LGDSIYINKYKCFCKLDLITYLKGKITVLKDGGLAR